MSQDQGDAAATWEDPNIGRAQKRRRVMGPAKEAGPLVDATIEVPETILMQWNEQYGQNMVRLTEEAQSKIADKAAVAVSQPYLDGVYDFRMSHAVPNPGPSATSSCQRQRGS